MYGPGIRDLGVGPIQPHSAPLARRSLSGVVGQGSGFRIRVQGSGSGFRVRIPSSGSGFRVQGQGSGFRVRFWVSGPFQPHSAPLARRSLSGFRVSS